MRTPRKLCSIQTAMGRGVAACANQLSRGSDVRLVAIAAALDDAGSIQFVPRSCWHSSVRPRACEAQLPPPPEAGSEATGQRERASAAGLAAIMPPAATSAAASMWLACASTRHPRDPRAAGMDHSQDGNRGAGALQGRSRAPGSAAGAVPWAAAGAGEARAGPPGSQRAGRPGAPALAARRSTTPIPPSLVVRHGPGSAAVAAGPLLASGSHVVLLHSREARAAGHAHVVDRVTPPAAGRVVALHWSCSAGVCGRGAGVLAVAQEASAAVLLWSAALAVERWPLPAADKEVTEVRWSRCGCAGDATALGGGGGPVLAAGTAAGRVWLYSRSDGRRYLCRARHKRRIACVSWSARRAVAAASDDALSVCDAAGAALRFVRFNGGKPLRLAFSAQGTFVACQHDNGALTVARAAPLAAGDGDGDGDVELAFGDPAFDRLLAFEWVGDTQVALVFSPWWVLLVSVAGDAAGVELARVRLEHPMASAAVCARGEELFVAAHCGGGSMRVAHIVGGVVNQAALLDASAGFPAHAYGKRERDGGAVGLHWAHAQQTCPGLVVTTQAGSVLRFDVSEALGLCVAKGLEAVLPSLARLEAAQRLSARALLLCLAAVALLLLAAAWAAVGADAIHSLKAVLVSQPTL